MWRGRGGCRRGRGGRRDAHAGHQGYTAPPLVPLSQPGHKKTGILSRFFECTWYTLYLVLDEGQPWVMPLSEAPSVVMSARHCGCPWQPSFFCYLRAPLVVPGESCEILQKMISQLLGENLTVPAHYFCQTPRRIIGRCQLFFKQGVPTIVYCKKTLPHSFLCP